jgi:hypothetical protein
MGPLAVSAFSPLTLSAASALRPVQALPLPAAPNPKTSTATTLAIQDLAQGLFQRNLQAATLSALAEPAAGSAGLAAEAIGSLLAALTAPQAPAETTTMPDATTVPTAVQSANASSTPTSAATSAPTATVPEVPAALDLNALNLGQDFALEAALRFGAGVASQVAPTLQAGVPGAGLVRDAAAVPRLGNLQSRPGGPGPEAFAQRQAAVQRVVQTYDALPASQGFGAAGQMDVLA